MELVGIIINLGVFAGGIVAAIIAWRAVRDAQTARDDAKHHEAEALAASKLSAASAAASAAAQRDAANAAARSSDAHTRSAAALERQTAIAEASAQKVDPWLFEPLGDMATDQPWRVTNKTGENVRGVQLGTPDGFNEQWVELSTDPVDLERNAHVTFTWLHRYTSPSSAVVWVFWVDGMGERQKFTKTIP